MKVILTREEDRMYSCFMTFIKTLFLTMTLVSSALVIDEFSIFVKGGNWSSKPWNWLLVLAFLGMCFQCFELLLCLICCCHDFVCTLHSLCSCAHSYLVKKIGELVLFFLLGELHLYRTYSIKKKSERKRKIPHTK